MFRDFEQLFAILSIFSVTDRTTGHSGSGQNTTVTITSCA